jgi:ribitol-5-phosphate 2-dehydrogenase
VYRLVAPKRFEQTFQSEEIAEDTVIVRPSYLSICHADQRYYQGERSAEILAEKLPMALIHEAIGTVVYSKDKTIQVGQRVVMIPNMPQEQDAVIAENYLRSSHFRSSGYDGFMQELVYTNANRVLLLPESLPDEVAAYTELVSVGYHAVHRLLCYSHARRENVGIWGDGNLGFITALLIKKLSPQTKITVCGVNEEKLANFSFVDDTMLITQLPKDWSVDHAVECVGGIHAEAAIEQIIEHIRPEGTIALLGVSEIPPKIATRMVLEKGLHLFGSSRSGRSDFAGLLELYRQESGVVEYLASLLCEVVPVRTLSDMVRAFERDKAKQMGKIVMKWEG